jgi:membrane protein required for colicin V production
MTLFDYAVLIIVGLSVLLSVIRGLVRELLALAGWIVAFVAAGLWGGSVAPLLPDEIPDEALRMLAAFLIVFLVALLACSVIAIAVSQIVRSAGLGAEDRVLGGLFGLARGVLIVMVLVLLAGLTPLPRQPVWNNAMLSAPLEALASALLPLLPQGWARHIRYD